MDERCDDADMFSILSLLVQQTDVVSASAPDWGDVAWAALLALLASGPLAVSVWALLDAARRPGWAWALTERRQAVWMAAIMFGTFTLVGGLAISAWYLTKIRPQIAAAEFGMPGTV